MSQYLDKEQQQRFDKIVYEFTVKSGVEQSGLTIKIGSNLVYRQNIEFKADIDQIKPDELDKLEEAVFNPAAAQDLIEMSIYSPGTEEVFRYENGDVNISHRYANQQRESSAESQQLLDQQNNIQYQADLQLQQQTDLQPKTTTQEPSQDNNSQSNNKIYLDKEFGYVDTDYYLKGTSTFGGEGADKITPSSIYMMGEMGVNWNYVIEKLSLKKEATQPAPEIPPSLTSPVHQHSPNQTPPNQSKNLLFSFSQQQNWANLSLDERLEAIRAQYGTNQQPLLGEKQQQQYRDRSR